MAKTDIAGAEALGRALAVVERLEDWTFLDRPADAVGKLVASLLPAGLVKDYLCGRWMRHPLHPALVAVPAGSLLSATMLDLTGLGGAGRRARRGGDRGRGARRLVAIGVAAAVPAAAAGLADWSDTTGAERRVGLAHAGINIGGIALYSASWWRRRQGRGAVLAAMGAGCLAAGGWLGGHLAYAQGVGVDTTAFQAGPTEWTAIGALEDLAEGELQAVDLDGVSIVVLRRGNRVLALADRCTHRGGPLFEGELRGTCVVCPWHASVFDMVDGSVVSGPATRPQPRYETRVIGDQVELRRSESRSLRRNPVGSG